MDVWEGSGKEIVHTTRAQHRHARRERAGAHVVGEERACGGGATEGRRCASERRGERARKHAHNTTHLPRDRNTRR